MCSHITRQDVCIYIYVYIIVHLSNKYMYGYRWHVGKKDLDKYFYYESIIKEERRDHISPHLGLRSGTEGMGETYMQHKDFIEPDLADNHI